VIPLYVNFGVNSYKDNVDIKPPELFRKVKESGILPMTSAPTVADFIAEFKKYIDKDMDIIHISISSKISASYQNACNAALQFPDGRITVIDSLNLSSGIGMLVMKAADCIGSGMSRDDTVRTVITSIPKVRTEFIIDTVEYLHRGGRCSGLQMLMSSLLEIHPIIRVADGSMQLAAKVRGNRQVVLNRLIKDAVNVLDKIDPTIVFITHAESDDDAVLIKNRLTGYDGIKHLAVTDASCVISSHCGPKTIGIIYMEK